jgi:hypothetical protein
MTDPNTEQSATTDEHLAVQVAKYLGETGQAYLSPPCLDVTRDGANVIVQDRPPAFTNTNGVVLAYEVLKDSGILMSLEMKRDLKDRLYLHLTPYSAMQRAAHAHRVMLDSALETATENLRYATVNHGPAFAMRQHGKDAFVDTAERYLWRELEKDGDLVDVLGRAVQMLYRTGESTLSDPLSEAARAAARIGYAKFVRSAAQLALLGNLLPKTFVDHLFSI